MKIENHKWWSPHLNQDMELMVYGWFGSPVLVFPSMQGRHFDYADRGMIEACAAFIEDGRFKFYCVDSIDSQSWCNSSAHPADRARRHEDYDRYITQEVMPFIRQTCNNEAIQAITTGVSMGGYHAANFFFRHPEIFNGVISLSGIMHPRLFIGDYMDETVYLNSPLAFLPNLADDDILTRYRRSDIIVCVGQGAWEDEMRLDADELRSILAAKDIPAWVDFWGFDVNHDWNWWQVQMPYFLGKLLEAQE